MSHRVLVALAPRIEGEELAIVVDPIRIAVMPWFCTSPMLAVVARMSFSISDGGALSPIAPPPFVEVPAGDELPWPCAALAPYKPACDVLLRGHVEIDSAGPGAVASLALRVGGARVQLGARSSLPAGSAERVHLGGGALVGPDGLEGADAPARAPALPSPLELPPDADFGRLQLARPALRVEPPQDGAALGLEGLSKQSGDLRLQLPERAPRVLVDWAAPDRELTALAMLCDTVALDLDARTLDVTWRGNLELEGSVREIERLIVAVTELPEDDDEVAEVRYAAALRELPHGRFFYATEPHDVAQRVEPPELSAEDLAMARLDAWSEEGAASPTLPLEAYVELSVELSEQRRPREEVLRAHGLDEIGWSVEERSWTETLSRIPHEGETGGVHDAYARLVAETRAKHADASEAARTPAEYGTIAARLERLAPDRVLAEAGIGLGAWLRLEERMARRYEEDPAARREIDEAIEAELRRLGPEQGPEPDEAEGR